MKRVRGILCGAIALALMLAGTAWAADFQWEQVVSDGFDVPGNWSMYGEAVFRAGGVPYLYMGTANTAGGEVWRSPGGDEWTRVFKGDPTQSYMKHAVAFRRRLYMGTATETPGVGAEIWRTDGNVWEQVVVNGYGDANNQEMLGAAQFGRYLYFGTGNNFTGAEIWRTREGKKWRPVMEGGFGDTNTREVSCLIVFRRRLYAGTENNETGAEVWRTWNGARWRLIEDTAGGFGDVQNSEIHAMAVHNGHLYVVTENDGGGEVWRTWDGTTWECVVSGGFAGVQGDFEEAVSFGGYIWVSTEAPPGENAQIYRSASGASGTWEDALSDVSMAVGTVTAFKEFQGALYVGTQAPAEIWRVRSLSSPRTRRRLRRLARDLVQSWPNPFNPETTIRYDVPGGGTVRLSIYALNGQLVRILVNDERPAGSYSVVWDGRDENGRDVASGVYLCRMGAGEYRAAWKMTVVR